MLDGKSSMVPDIDLFMENIRSGFTSVDSELKAVSGYDAFPYVSNLHFTGRSSLPAKLRQTAASKSILSFLSTWEWAVGNPQPVGPPLIGLMKLRLLNLFLDVLSFRNYVCSSFDFRTLPL